MQEKFAKIPLIHKTVNKMEDNSIQDFYFTHKKKYKYTVYEYSELSLAKSILYNDLVCRLSTHDRLLYRSASHFKTFNLSDGTIIRFTDGTAILFETPESYRAWLFTAKCINYALKKWGNPKILAEEGIEYLTINDDLAEILIMCSEFKQVNEWSTHSTLDGMFLASNNGEKFMVFNTGEDMYRYIDLNSG